MTGEERKALAFVAILLGLSAVARAVNRPDPLVVTGAAAVPTDQRLAQNRAVREQQAPPSGRGSAARKPRPEPVWRTPGAGVVIDNRPPKGAPLEKLNVNKASAAELDALPGISPAVAQRIVEYRAAHGPFTAIEQLDSVKGIGPKVLEKVRPHVRIR